MAIDTINPTEQQPGTFEHASPEAFEFMQREGYALIKGLASNSTREAVLQSLDDKQVFDGPQAKYIQDREQYSPHMKSEPLEVFRSDISAAMAGMGDGNPDMALWSQETVEGLPPIRLDVFKYKDGIDFARHTDSPTEGFLTQAITTFRGSATVHFFDDMETETPAASLKVEAGDTLLIRGDEFEGGQLPHSVSDISGDRVIAAAYPERTYKEDVASLRYRRERDVEWDIARKGRMRRIAHAMGQRLLPAERVPAIADSPDPTRYIRIRTED